MAGLYIVIATIGRPDVLRRVVERVPRQTRRPDAVVVAATGPDDVTGLAGLPAAPEILFAPRGSCHQRNAALDHLRPRLADDDIVLFLDDDFVMADDYCATMAAAFAADPALAGATGRLIADGAGTGGLDFADALALLARDAGAGAAASAAPAAVASLYGCNMAMRRSAMGDNRFDEMLPLYGWLEDEDYSRRVGRSGRLVAVPAAAGVHLGNKGGRTSGLRLGYSQVANPVYLSRKGVMPWRVTCRMLARPLLGNLLRSAVPEPHIDRRGRLRGNLIALMDLARNRSDPRRISTLS